MYVEIEAPTRVQYIMSLNIWDTWKFEWNMAAQPGFTRKLTGDVYAEHDAGVALEALTWYNVIVTHGAGHQIFYINGELVKDWDAIRDAATIAADPDVNLVIGSFKPTDLDWVVDSWFTSFHGWLDDIRIYDKALTAAEVTALYTMEAAD